MNFVRRMVLNPVAANMLMVLILGGGLVAALVIPREVFPEFDLGLISVTVPYPGASPSDIEQSICLKIEDRLTGMEGVKEISASSTEGAGLVTLELETGADTRKVLDDVKTEVDKIDFPEDAEDAVVIERTFTRQVIYVAVAGEAEERTLKELAEEVREELNDLPAISQVSVQSVRDYEIAVEVSEEALRRHKLTLGRVALAIRESSLDLPAGKVRTRGGEMSVRVMGEKRTAEQYKDIVVLSKPDGTVVRLADVATIREGFADVDVGGQFNGQPAALVTVLKTADEDSIKIAQAVRDYVRRKAKEVPEGITLETWYDSSRFIEDRLSMLVRNGAWGLALVFLILWFVLGARLSVWVALGIPLSLLGTVLVLNLSGMTLNMMTMFALIMALGLIVDDAIVVGENVYRQVELGQPPRVAAITGTRAVLLPVVAAVVTTWLAFLPMLFLPGVMGKFVAALPIVVILALGFSLLECLLILPPHLAHSLRASARLHERRWRPTQWADRLRGRLDAGVRWFIDVPFTGLYRLATRYRYVTVVLFAAVAILVGAAKQAGYVPFVVFPKGMDSDILMAKVTLPTGTLFERTREVSQQISLGALEINDALEAQGRPPVVERVYAHLGQQSGAMTAGASGAHLCEVLVELTPSERRTRDLNSEQLVRLWRQNTGPIPDALSTDFGSMGGGPGGAALEVRLLGADTDFVKPAAERLKDRLGEFQGVADIRDDALPGKMEMKVDLRSGAESLGISLRTLASQLRDAFYGNESRKIQRGRDEIKVMVRYPESERRSLGDVENMRVRTPAGAEVPFYEVAEAHLERGYTTLRRVSRRSVVTVTADVDEEVANAEEILTELSRPDGFFDLLKTEFPGLVVDLRGQRQQAYESLGALYVLYPMALLGIYTILAALFRSYVQPIIIMVAIPFGLVGAVIGHWLLGFDVTLLSMFGMVALAGIVVNDALVLIDRVNTNVRAGEPVLAAAEEGARTRFRPIILTTLTTVAGIGPLLFEQSFQAQFIKPMAISIAFGLLFATTLTLLLVPSLYLIGNDLRRAVRWLWRGRWPTPEEVVSRDEPLPEESETALAR